jgi:hypothetical protein
VTACQRPCAPWVRGTTVPASPIRVGTWPRSNVTTGVATLSASKAVLQKVSGDVEAMTVHEAAPEERLHTMPGQRGMQPHPRMVVGEALAGSDHLALHPLPVFESRAGQDDVHVTAQVAGACGDQLRDAFVRFGPGDNADRATSTQVFPDRW